MHDARGFNPETMRRATVAATSAGASANGNAIANAHDGAGAAAVTLLMGKRPSEHPMAPGAEQVITIMFDRSAGGGFHNDAAAEQWWHDNKSWLLALNPAV